MKTIIQFKLFYISILAVIIINSSLAEDLGSAFSYQGELLDNGSPASGEYDIMFKAYFFEVDGDAELITPTFFNVAVSHGRFTIPEVDFGTDLFHEKAVYLELNVKKSSEGGDYMTLSPRQRLSVAPFAVQSAFSTQAEFADNATNSDNATSANVANSLAPGSANMGDVLQFDGQAWSPAAVANNISTPWSSSNGDIYYNSGDVGIGLANPVTRLHVDSNAGFELSRFDGGDRMYNSFYENGLNRGYIGSFQNGSISGTSTADFEIGTSSVNSSGKMHITTQAEPRITVDDFGQVGIGNTEPEARLDVDGFQFLDPLNVTVSGITKFKVSKDGSVNIEDDLFVNDKADISGKLTVNNDIETSGNLTVSGDVSVEGDSKQDHDNNGMLKYMVLLNCNGNESSIIRQYNGTNSNGNVVVTSNSQPTGKCDVSFPTDIENRYWVVSSTTTVSYLHSTCDVLDHDSLRCEQTHIPTENTLSGKITILVY